MPIDFWSKVGKKCSCSVLKKSDTNYQHQIPMTGNKNPDFIFIFEFPEDTHRLKLFLEFLNGNGFDYSNSSFINAIGCRPRNYKLKSPVEEFSYCFRLNMAKQIKEKNPCVVFTVGRSIYALTGKTFIGRGVTPAPPWENFYRFESRLSTFYSPMVGCVVAPLPSLLSFVDHTYTRKWNDIMKTYIMQKGEMKLHDKFETDFALNQLYLAKHLKKKNSSRGRAGR